MGQKVHPTGFRLGISTEYSSKWYARSKDYSSYLLEDYRIREYLKKQLENASVSKIVIERPTKEAVVNIYTSRPGIVIGKKLANKLRLNIGDSIKIISSKSYETLVGNIPREASFKVIGFFEIGMYEYDTSLVFFPYGLMKQFLNKKNPDHYEILLKDLNI